MNSKTFLVTFLTLALILMTCLSGCERVRQVISPDVSTPDAAATVKIGVIQPANFGPSFAKGAELARTQINASGGVLEMHVEFIVKDNQGADPLPRTEESVRVARELIEEDGVITIIGPLFSTNSTQVGPVATAHGILMIPGSSGQNVTSKGGEFVFLVVAPSSVQAAVMAQFAVDAAELNAKTAATIRQAGDVYSADLTMAFEENFQKFGGEIVASEVYQHGDENFDAQLMNINAAAPDTVFLASFFPEVFLVAAQAKAMGIEATLLGSDSWNDGNLLKTLDDNAPLEGAYFITDFSTESPDAAPFVEAYKAMFVEDADAIASWGYDAMGILATAIEAAGTLDSAAIRDALANVTNYQGASSIAGYDADRHPIKSVAINTIRDGEVALYKVFEP